MVREGPSFERLVRIEARHHFVHLDRQSVSTSTTIEERVWETYVKHTNTKQIIQKTYNCNAVHQQEPSWYVKGRLLKKFLKVSCKALEIRCETFPLQIVFPCEYKLI